ncbi:MAG: ribonuclease III, partial [Bacteroidota bacterium]
MKFLLRFYNYYLSKDKHFARRLYAILGFTPANLAIFRLAFYHKSTSTEKLYAIQSNERLEYLGDALLGTIVAEYLFKKYPNSNEGFLTKMRSKIVKRNSLNTIADKMGLDVFLAEYNKTRLSRSMLGNALEALIGAVYLEVGYRRTRNYVINKILRGYLNIHELENFDDNYKSQLLEYCQKNGQTVQYKMITKYKYEKRDRFKVAVLVDGKKLATADDFNKKSAEQIASEKAMLSLGILTNEEPEESPEPSNNRRQTSNRRTSSQSQSSRKRKPKQQQQREKSSDGVNEGAKERSKAVQKERQKPAQNERQKPAQNERQKPAQNERQKPAQNERQKPAQN